MHVCKVIFFTLLPLPYASLTAVLTHPQVHYDPELTGPRDLIAAVDDVGFEADLAVNRCGGGADQGPQVAEHSSWGKPLTFHA